MSTKNIAKKPKTIGWLIIHEFGMQVFYREPIKIGKFNVVDNTDTSTTHYNYLTPFNTKAEATAELKRRVEQITPDFKKLNKFTVVPVTIVLP